MPFLWCFQYDYICWLQKIAAIKPEFINYSKLSFGSYISFYGYQYKSREAKIFQSVSDLKQTARFSAAAWITREFLWATARNGHTPGTNSLHSNPYQKSRNSFNLSSFTISVCESIWRNSDFSGSRVHFSGLVVWTEINPYQIATQPSSWLFILRNLFQDITPRFRGPEATKEPKKSGCS